MFDVAGAEEYCCGCCAVAWQGGCCVVARVGGSDDCCGGYIVVDCGGHLLEFLLLVALFLHLDKKKIKEKCIFLKFN